MLCILKLHTLDYTPDHPKVLCFYDVKLIKYKIVFFLLLSGGIWPKHAVHPDFSSCYSVAQLEVTECFFIKAHLLMSTSQLLIYNTIFSKNELAFVKQQRHNAIKLGEPDHQMYLYDTKYYKQK